MNFNTSIHFTWPKTPNFTNFIYNCFSTSNFSWRSTFIWKTINGHNVTAAKMHSLDSVTYLYSWQSMLKIRQFLLAVSDFYYIIFRVVILFYLCCVIIPEPKPYSKRYFISFWKIGYIRWYKHCFSQLNLHMQLPYLYSPHLPIGSEDCNAFYLSKGKIIQP